MYWIDENWFICKWEPTNQKVCFNIFGLEFHTYQKKILVYYKRKIIPKEINQVSSGMNVFKATETKNIKNKVDEELFYAWLGIYKEFVEETWKETAYVYKASKEQGELINEIIANLWFSIFLKLHKNFLYLDWDILNLNDTKSKLNEAIEQKNYDKIFSFILGLSIAYWDFDIKNNILNNIKINIPFVGKLQAEINFFDDFFINFKKEDLVINKDILEKKFWFVYQLVIKDWEILDFIINTNTIFENIENWKKRSLSSYIQQLTELIWPEEFSKINNIKIFTK